MKLRYEPFGAIAAFTRPPMLVYVDKDALTRWGLPAHPLWQTESRILSAPIEAHLTVTRRCSAGCANCYVAATPKPDADELDTAGWKEAIDKLAEFGVFHVAMGGGESLEREDLFELAAYARSRGVVPNLTTNGLFVTEKVARACRIFGQVNVSLDDLSPVSVTGRGIRPEQAIAALKRLRAARVRCGINMVVSRRSYDGIGEMVRLARKLKLHDVELLRFKPFGRGRTKYEEHALTPQQARDFYPTIRKLAKRLGVSIKVDCSFVPMIASHAPDRNTMEFFGVLGCEAGNHLIGVQPNGQVAGCSFLEPFGVQARSLPENWTDSPELQALRNWRDNAPEPCASCDYLDLCNGGCRAVTRYLCGEDRAPDPECPRVVSYRNQTR